MGKGCINIFIPSYKRADNLKTVVFLEKLNWDMKKVHVVIDSEAEDEKEYREACEGFGCNLHVFDIDESRRRYDYVHRPTEARRSAGQARNMIYDIAKRLGIDFYCVQDDDTVGMEVKYKGRYKGMAEEAEIKAVFKMVEVFMRKRKIGLFGLSQTGDFIGGANDKILRNKVMNCSFYLTDYIYRGERGVQDNDTSQFVNLYNEGYFTGSVGEGLVLKQMQSATQKGGLTDLYNEAKLLNKALVCPIQFPSAIYADRQSKNGGRVHHKIMSRYLKPKLIKIKKGEGMDNIAWDTYNEDRVFTSEPKR